MGYALFTARKMSLQAKVNQYNMKLMQLANQEEQLTNKSSLRQTVNNSVDKAQSTASLACNIGDLFTGGAASLVAGVANFAIDTVQSKSDEAYEAEINAEQQKIDTEKQRLNTLLNAAQAELENVEKAEQSAIKSAAPSYVG